jgi:hypothetical protein
MVIIYEMGAAPVMSRPVLGQAPTNAPFVPIFWQTFMVTPTSEDSVPESAPAEAAPVAAAEAPAEAPAKAPPEIGGREGPSPTRFGDWELRGRCIDF